MKRYNTGHWYAHERFGNNMTEHTDISTHPLVGVWHCTPYPTRETTLLLYPTGQGLMFYYWGSQDGTPFVDEFTWAPAGDGEVYVSWQVLHGVDYGDEDEEEDTGADYDPNAPLPPLTIISNREETVCYTLIDVGGRRQLDISLGEHMSFSDDLLSYAGPPGDFATGRQALLAQVEHFDPFGPGRQVWLVGEDGWHPTPYAIAPEESEHTAGQRIANEISEQFFPLRLLPLIIGIFGCIGYLSEYLHGRLPDWLVIGLVMLPALLILFRSDGADDSPWSRLITGARTFAAMWNLLLALLVFAGIATGYHPRGWPLYLILVGVGLIVPVQVFWARRRHVKGG